MTDRPAASDLSARELDALYAEHVLGWTDVALHEHASVSLHPDDNKWYGIRPGADFKVEVPHFTLSLDACRLREVCELHPELGSVGYEYDCDRKVHYAIVDGIRDASDDEAARAVVVAVLRALEVIQ